jgi:hypothetical protein
MRGRHTQRESFEVLEDSVGLSVTDITRAKPLGQRQSLSDSDSQHKTAQNRFIGPQKDTVWLLEKKPKPDYHTYTVVRVIMHKVIMHKPHNASLWGVHQLGRRGFMQKMHNA